MSGKWKNQGLNAGLISRSFPLTTRGIETGTL